MEEGEQGHNKRILVLSDLLAFRSRESNGLLSFKGLAGSDGKDELTVNRSGYTLRRMYLPFLDRIIFSA